MGTKHLRLVDEVVGVCRRCRNPFFFTVAVKGSAGVVYIPAQDRNLEIESGRVLHLRMLHPEVGFIGELLGQRAPKPNHIERVRCGELRFLNFHVSPVRRLEAVRGDYVDPDMNSCEAVMQVPAGRSGRPSSHGIPL
ncbi:MAG: hypothetical protein HY475_01910 [Candidatus Terrybacteria bacterium]|nr:hypothetical protein [Candidatus Terrybacteria bacterium]